MSRAEATDVIDLLPSGALWEFGGHDYALEPLALPERWLPLAAGEEADQVMMLVTRLSALDQGFGPHSSPRQPAGPSEIDRMFWFRWITGHQATFVIWQLLAATVEEILVDPADPGKLLDRARLLVRGYSLMLLYTGSVPRETYHRVIRPSMARHHLNLSGSWARDYAPVLPILRCTLDFGVSAQVSALRGECELVERVHRGIALKLVPSGISLLQNTDMPRGPWRMPRQALMTLYDALFLTLRRPVSYEVVVRQLIRRLHAIALDVSVNGMEPRFAPSRHQEPPQLRAPEIFECRESFIASVLGLIELVGDAVTAE